MKFLEFSTLFGTRFWVKWRQNPYFTKGAPGNARMHVWRRNLKDFRDSWGFARDSWGFAGNSLGLLGIIGERDPNFLRGLIQILPKKYTFFSKEKRTG